MSRAVTFPTTDQVQAGAGPNDPVAFDLALELFKVAVGSDAFIADLDEPSLRLNHHQLLAADHRRRFFQRVDVAFDDLDRRGIEPSAANLLAALSAARG